VSKEEEEKGWVKKHSLASQEKSLLKALAAIEAFFLHHDYYENHEGERIRRKTDQLRQSK